MDFASICGDAGAGAARCVASFRVVLRHHPSGSDSCRCEADRGAMGRRRRRLSGGEFSGAVGGVERKISRHGAAILEGRQRAAFGFCIPADRVQDLYQFDGRSPYASINFVTAHDGFTLCDLVSYNEKHNEANGDNNSDGSDNNDSWNMGAEGPTDDPDDQRDARAADAEFPGDADALAGRSDAGWRR